MYVDRLAVQPNHLRKGIGSVLLKEAAILARGKGAKALRLFVVDINEPAIHLYLKNGFKKMEGIYTQVIDEDLALQEYGFEIDIC